MFPTSTSRDPLLTAYLLENATTGHYYQAMSKGSTLRVSTATNSTTAAPSTGTGLTVFSIVLIVMYIPFLVVAALGNMTVIVVRLKSFRQRGLSAYKQLICHLSLADIIYATAIPLDIYLKINNKHWLQHSFTCKILTTTQSASLTASVCILTAMAFERFQGISNPLAHHWSTKKVYYSLSIFSKIFSVLFYSIILFYFILVNS